MKTHKIRLIGCYSGMFETVQNEVEGKNKKVSVVTSFIPSVPRDKDTGSIVPLPVDQFTGKSFMRNKCGFPMNDIMAFETIQSDQLARAVLQRTQIINFPKNEEMSLEDQFASIVPSNWSSPAEYLRASEQFAKMAYAKHIDQIRVKVSEQNPVVNDDVSKNVVTVEPE